MIFLKTKRKSKDINIEQLEYLLKNNNDIILLDVRSPQEYKEGHLNSAINIPSYELSPNVINIIKDFNKIIIVYCLSGRRSKKVVNQLEKFGYRNIYNLKNGIEEYN